MPNSAISDYDELTVLAVGDLFEAVDVSDTSLAPTGTNKYITAANIAAFLLASPTITGTAALAAMTASGTIVQTSADAAAFASGPAGNTNPVFRIVNSTASQAAGLQLTGAISGGTVSLSAIDSGSNAGLSISSKGNGTLLLTSSTGTVQISGQGTLTTIGNDISFPSGANVKWSTDTALKRNAAGIVEVNNGTAGAFRDLLARAVKLGAATARGTTEGTNTLSLFDGTAPAGTLTNGVSLYSDTGELRSMDAAGNNTLLSPHDREGNWIHDEVNYKGRRLRVDMERLIKAVDKLLGGGFVEEHAG